MSSTYLPVTDPLYAYLLEHRSGANDPLMDELRAETRRLGPEVSEMAISPDQCSLLQMLSALLGTRHAVEIGTFTGSSAISIARGMLPGGKLICFDKDFRYTSIARRYWFRAGLQDRIEVRLGDAPTLLHRFRPRAPLDLVFIDADKESYDLYFEIMLPLVRPNGLIIFDNMLRGGRVLDPPGRQDASVRAIDQLNRKLAIDPRVQSVMLPIADGIHLCRKRARDY
jgi:caffeoyl-CoA O-methyltransferase